MQTISVAELRQNPSEVIEATSRGQTFVVTRYRREVARLVPPLRHQGVTPDQFADLLAANPVDQGWEQELAQARQEDEADDPWAR